MRVGLAINNEVGPRTIVFWFLVVFLESTFSQEEIETQTRMMNIFFALFS